jgi:hypothetical protein
MHTGRRLRIRVHRTWVTRPPRSRAPPSSGAPSAPPRAPGRRAPPASPLSSPPVPPPRSPRQTRLRTLLLAEPPLLADVGRGAGLGSGLGGRAAPRRPLEAEGARGGVAGRPAPDGAEPEGSSPRSEHASADLAPRSVRCARSARTVIPTLWTTRCEPQTRRNRSTWAMTTADLDTVVRKGKVPARFTACGSCVLQCCSPGDVLVNLAST